MKLGKVTGKRWYDDGCGTALALEFLGERWALLVVRELLLGPRRFGEIREGLAGVSANILAQRLQTLETAGILSRETAPSPANVPVYALTSWGREAEPIVMALGRWALRSPAHDPSLPFSAVSLMLALRMMLVPGRARAFAATIGFRTGKDVHCVRIVSDAVSIERGGIERADAVLTGAPSAFLPALFGTTPLPDLVARDTVGVDGDLALATRFCTFFELPPKVGCN